MTEPTDAEPPSADYLVEEPRLFSESLIWDLQRQFYAHHGIGAWAEGKVPFGISTSSHIAAAYARVVFGFLRDCLSTLDTSEPVYILSLIHI